MKVRTKAIRQRPHTAAGAATASCSASPTSAFDRRRLKPDPTTSILPLSSYSNAALDFGEHPSDS